MLSFIDLNRPDDIMPLLKTALQAEQTHTFNKDVLEKAKEFLEKTGNKELQTDFEHTMKYFNENGNISDTTLEGQLTAEIQASNRQAGDFRKPNFVRRNQQRQPPTFQSRPGLRNLD